MFYGCSINLSNFNVSSVLNMSNMFYGCSSLSSLDLSNFIPNNTLDMEDMFYGCSNLYSLDLSNFNTLSVLNMSTVNYEIRPPPEHKKAHLQL